METIELILFIAFVLFNYLAVPKIADFAFADFMKYNFGLEWSPSESESEKKTYSKLVIFSSYVLFLLVILNYIQ